MFISRILKVLFHECNIKLKTAKLRNDYGNGNIQRNLAKITKIIQTVCCVTNEQQQPKRKKFQSFFFVHCLSLVLHFCLQSRPFFHKNINYHIDSVDSTHLDLVGSLEKRHTHTHKLTHIQNLNDAKQKQSSKVSNFSRITLIQEASHCSTVLFVLAIEQKRHTKQHCTAIRCRRSSWVGRRRKKKEIRESNHRTTKIFLISSVVYCHTRFALSIVLNRVQFEWTSSSFWRKKKREMRKKYKERILTETHFFSLCCFNV